MNRTSRLLVIVAVLATLFACGDWQRAQDEMELNYNYMLLKAYFRHPERIKDLSEYEGEEIDSMYSSLKDYFRGSRYTFYVAPSKSEETIDRIQNSKRYYSFGFEREAKSDTLIVSAVYPFSPANNSDSGLIKRDKLLQANDVLLTELTKETIDAYLKNDSLFDSSTVFTVLRGEEVIKLPAMQKAEVKIPTVFLDSLDNIPYIKVTGYTVSTNHPKGTYYEFKDILSKIKSAKVAIMDLRRNGGGSIWHCTMMAAELAPLNKELLYDVEHGYSDDRGNVIDTIRHYAGDYLDREGDGVNIKWIILIDSGSASCAERFVVAVKSSRPETVIIGERSYGKGIGQIYTKTYLGGLAYITFMQSFFPSGETFHEIGIEPDPGWHVTPSNADIYPAALQAAQQFGAFDAGVLAKRSPSTQPATLPPEHKAGAGEPGMYKEILFQESYTKFK